MDYKDGNFSEPIKQSEVFLEKNAARKKDPPSQFYDIKGL